jgi:ribose transport system permease protein
VTAAANGVSRSGGRGLRLHLGRHRGLIVAIAVFAILFEVVDLLVKGPVSYFEVSFLVSGSTALALAGMGETMVILTGGFDLSAGAVISLVNVILATNMESSLSSQFIWGAAAIAVGAVVGTVNGFFVAVMRLQPIVVTLASMFIVQGLTLLVLDKPGGEVPYEFGGFLTGDAISDLIPGPLVLILIALVIWGIVRNSRFGTGMYAIGSDEEAAVANGIPVWRVKFFTYVLAGAFYGAAGLFISAQTGSGDPLVGNPMLLEIFAAVVLGGTRLGGGRGGCLGTVFGALTLMLTVNLLLVLDVSAYYSTVAEAGILVFAVLGASVGRDSAIADTIRTVRLRLRGWSRHAAGAHQHEAQPTGSQRPAGPPVRANDELSGGAVARWLQTHRETLRFVLPSYGFLVLVLVATGWVFGSESLFTWQYLNTLLVLTSFLAILGLGQGAVILTGGLDLSVPWSIAFCGILLTGMVQGQDEPALWAIPLVLVVGLLIGLWNGLGVVILGIHPIVITLATNGILQGLALVYSNGTPQGWAPPALRGFMNGKFLGLAPGAWFLMAFIVVAILVLSRTPFGRRVYAVGNSIRVAKLSGVGVGQTLLGVYVLSGFCSALVGLLLAGFNNQAFLGMGDSYLLPSIAVVVVGGTLITGGRGHYAGILGGCLLLTALGTLLAGTTLPFAVRDIIYGLVVLGAVVTLRERTT